jgi:hypothetical protein
MPVMNPRRRISFTAGCATIGSSSSPSSSIFG